MAQSSGDTSKPLGLIWVDCLQSVVTAGLEQALRGQARLHYGEKPPERVPSCIILCVHDQEEVSEGVERHRELSPDTPPIVVFGSHLDLPLARDALRAGASGFTHARMTPDQLVRAVAVAAKGELVAPRELIRYLIVEEQPEKLSSLSARQREILMLVAEGLSNAEIAGHLFLSESTIKQHLRATYKILKVNNRTEAANLIRRSG